MTVNIQLTLLSNVKSTPKLTLLHVCLLLINFSTLKLKSNQKLTCKHNVNLSIGIGVPLALLVSIISKQMNSIKELKRVGILK